MAKPKQDIVEEAEDKKQAKDEAPKLSEGRQARQTSPGIPRVMVTWNPVGTELTEKVWHGIRFEPGVPMSVEHMPEPKWREMLRSIDQSQGAGGWTYAYQVDEEAPPEPPPEGGEGGGEEEIPETRRRRY